MRWKFWKKPKPKPQMLMGIPVVWPDNPGPGYKSVEDALGWPPQPARWSIQIDNPQWSSKPSHKGNRNA